MSSVGSSLFSSSSPPSMARVASTLLCRAACVRATTTPPRSAPTPTPRDGSAPRQPPSAPYSRTAALPAPVRLAPPPATAAAVDAGQVAEDEERQAGVDRAVDADVEISPSPFFWTLHMISSSTTSYFLGSNFQEDAYTGEEDIYLSDSRGSAGLPANCGPDDGDGEIGDGNLSRTGVPVQNSVSNSNDDGARDVDGNPSGLVAGVRHSERIAVRRSNLVALHPTEASTPSYHPRPTGQQVRESDSCTEPKPRRNLPVAATDKDQTSDQHPPPGNQGRDRVSSASQAPPDGEQIRPESRSGDPPRSSPQARRDKPESTNTRNGRPPRGCPQNEEHAPAFFARKRSKQQPCKPSR
ncbi:hypothetical protein B0H12DRAFT_1078256 [Mycena haematopus]|nr:hypothetical protein B0H12DRAFT_1078256 [Mycena haematopus]